MAAIHVVHPSTEQIVVTIRGIHVALAVRRVDDVVDTTPVRERGFQVDGSTWSSFHVSTMSRQSGIAGRSALSSKIAEIAIVLQCARRRHVRRRQHEVKPAVCPLLPILPSPPPIGFHLDIRRDVPLLIERQLARTADGVEADKERGACVLSEKRGDVASARQLVQDLFELWTLCLLICVEDVGFLGSQPG